MQFLRWFFPISALAILAYAWSIAISNNGGLSTTFTAQPAALSYHIFRLAGITAFILVSFQILTGPYMKFWERLYGKKFYLWHAFQGIFALLFALLHPGLLLISLSYQHIDVFGFALSQPIQYYFGPTALLLLLLTVPTAAGWILVRYNKFERLWHWIHLANYAVFLLVFFHSVSIGSDVAPTDSPLRPIWYLFFIAMLGGLIYRRIMRVRQEGTSGLNE